MIKIDSKNIQREKARKHHKIYDMDFKLESPDPYYLAALELAGNAKDAYYFYTEFDILYMYKLLAQKLGRSYEPLPPKWWENI